MAVFHAVLCFVYLAGKGVFRTRDLLPDVQQNLGLPEYRLSQLRYDLSKLRGKGLVTRVPQTQTYQLSDEGRRLAILYLKLYQRIYAPLTSAIQAPFAADLRIATRRQCRLDRLYTAVDKALQKLASHLAIAA
jgi:hypothetical protein